MIRGLYTAAAGMNAEMLHQDVVANNLANVSTTGFKKDDAVFEAFPDRLQKRLNDRMDQGMAAGPQGTVMSAQPVTVGVLGQGVRLAETVTHFTDGSLFRTDRPLDIGLQGNGMFTVERGDGSIAYTRNGNFTLDSEQRLSTMNGELVLGKEGQPITVRGDLVVVDSQGVIKVDGAEAGRLQFALYDPERFSKLGENLWVRVPDAIEGYSDQPEPTVHVEQGFVEQANVQVVEEMVRMISVMRAYEANQKSIQMQDDTLNQLINQVGRS